MSAKHNFKFDEARLKDGQRKAALTLAANEFLPKNERTPLREIWEEAGVTQMTLWRWRHEDENFIAYKNYLASNMLDEHLPLVYGKLLESVNRGSVKAIELFMKRIGDLDTKTEVTVKDDKNDDSIEERIARLRERAEEAFKTEE